MVRIYGNDFISIEEKDIECGGEDIEIYFGTNSGFSRHPTVVNLGVYFDSSRGRYRADRFIGVMPLARKNIGDSKIKWEKPELKDRDNIIVINSRFGNPMQMLQDVLRSRECYDTQINTLLSPKIYKWDRWCRESFNKKNDSVLYGIVSDLPEISIPNEDKCSDKKIYIKTLIDMNDVLTVGEFLYRLKQICQTSIKKESIKYEENLIGKIKGKIDFNKHVKYNLSRARIDRNYCVYNKMDIDTQENRILKYALFLCKKWSIQSADCFSEDIAFCESKLKNVKLIKCGKKNIQGIKNNGAYKQYKATIQAAALIFERMSIALDKDAGTNKLQLSSKIRPFFIRIDLLFELYCRALVEEALELLPECKLKLTNYSDNDGKKNELEVFETNQIPYGFQNRNIPDICIEDENGKKILIMDAKYMPLEKKEEYMVREITHQILAYMFLTGADHGGFIYPAQELVALEKKDLKDIQKIDAELVNMTQNEKYGYSIGINLQDNFIDNSKKIKELIEKVIKLENKDSKEA